MAKLSLRDAQQTQLFTFSFPLRIYYEDTDSGGVVYHGQYVRFLERARTEWLRFLGFNNIELERKYKMLWVVTEMTMQFLKPARLDDNLEVTVAVETMGRVRCTFRQEVKRGEEVILKARVTVASVSANAMKPIEFPADVKRKMEATLS
ncbi:MAG: tol-pal system-associated acyl-CoA thioesterase [Rhodocyclaceae bacterium]|nr:tol-pal system-associated acyl-CoA thioesterase [Rhodocyclaceae bacterium]MCA3017364.1 tol-pal system-associated acyl-CoA thioesterase [Rhodocyclaceae bacterium]MCA3024977.1 tol-pal system-associated acyl-CoA thioesterase [Rhodocyclaceae bacterium]MCA3033234.1 tol-pal system-associated acyl-CoA thioesterase [Rhodocyclaceae bacterium]MCA3036668.1 tol-pal system-associated acyl-CoA thioesterase [Rhodocyclaceae bacterium]